MTAPDPEADGAEAPGADINREEGAGGMGIFKGYGQADEKLAADLAKAGSPAEADKVAKADGHKDSADAAKWLKDRSE